MPTPSGRTYHYGKRDPLHDPRSPFRVVYRDQTTRPMQEVAPAETGTRTNFADVVRRHPGPALLAGAAAGFLITRWLRG